MFKNINKAIKSPGKALVYITHIFKGIIFAIPIKLLNYFIIVRLIPVRERFGQMVSQVNNYFTLKELGLISNSIDIFAIPEHAIINEFLAKVYTRKFVTIDYKTLTVTKKILGDRFNTKNAPNNNFHYEFIKDDLFHYTPSPIIFTEQEINVGNEYLNQFPSDHKGIVCFALKEQAYYDQFDNFENMIWPEHYIGDINDYEMAIKKFIDHGYFVMRMGSKVDSACKINDNYFFDYAASESRNDFLDIFIASRSIFSFGNMTAFHVLGELFRKPAFYTNVRNYPTIPLFFPFILLLPIKYYSKLEERELTFKDIFLIDKQIPNIDPQNWKRLNDEGIYVVKTNSIDLAAFADESIAFYEGIFAETTIEKQLQHKFWSLYEKMDVHFQNMNYKNRFTKISPQFLATNEWMLN